MWGQLVQGLVFGAICLVVQCATRADDPPAPAKKSSVERIPDPKFKARRGDLAMLYAYYARRDVVLRPTAAVDVLAYLDYFKAVEVDDRDGINELYDSGRVILVASKTGVLVLEVEDFPADDPRANCAVVRITDGPLKGKKFHVMRATVCRLMANPNYEPPKEPAAEEPREEAPSRSGAAALLQSARNLEKAKKVDQAIPWYRRVVREYPDSKEAETARARLKVLEDR